jgi:hypothetical protein
MSQLMVANVQRCLDILKRFHQAANVDSSNEELKNMAGEALKHLDNLFAPNPGDFQFERSCDPRVQSIPS